MKIIQRIRESIPNSIEIYTEGSCVKFAMILLQLMPKGKILYNSDYAIFEYNEQCYDIEGIAKKTDDYIPIEEYGILQMYDLMNLKYRNNDERQH